MVDAYAGERSRIQDADLRFPAADDAANVRRIAREDRRHERIVIRRPNDPSVDGPDGL